ncbi:unnamed protein product [Ilex paraguariensis]|uniref:Proteasome alpha-type subunits domain-containing protein n=1 Tax=Ilex paraguariensis TaxID=185542 RepID=A0ABC8U9S8_9AQUA
MFRNQYDTDVTTWSPAGRLFQVEYAMEAVKQGSAAIGLRSKTHVVLASVNKANSELSSHQKKIFKVDDHIGVAIAGLTADGRVLSRYMRSECINYSYSYESPLPVGRLVVQLADKAQVQSPNPFLPIHSYSFVRCRMPSVGSDHCLMRKKKAWNPPAVPNHTSFGILSLDFIFLIHFSVQAVESQCKIPSLPYYKPINPTPFSITNPKAQPFPLAGIQVCTQRSWKRPYGVGLLVGGLDESGAHLYYNCPSGNYFEYQAFAMGSRSQAAKTYLERKFENFMDSSRDDLLKDALFALRETLQGEKLTSSICTVSVLGVGEAFHTLDQETVQALINAFEVVGEEGPTEEAAATDLGAAADQGVPADEGVAPMDI